MVKETAAISYVSYYKTTTYEIAAVELSKMVSHTAFGGTPSQ